MKKIINLLIVLFVMISLTACNKQEEKEVGLVNPMVEYDSLEAINNEVGVKLAKPEVEGVTNEKFFVIDGKIAEYDFTLKESNFTFRAAKDCNEDISGIYNNGELIFAPNNLDYGSYVTDDIKAFYFMENNDRYNMSIDGDIDDNTFVDIIIYVEDQINRLYADEALLDLLGEYQDMTSQRATMKIGLFDENRLSIGITWSSSADETDEWGITAKLNNGKIEYESQSILHYHTVGTESVLVNDSIDGYLEVKDDGIYWTGSGNELTSQCHFAKIVE